MTFGLRHLAPKLLQIALNGLILRVFAQGHGKPAIRGGKIVRGAETGRIKCAHFDHSFGIGRIRRGLEQAKSPLAILGCSAPIQIFLSFGHGVGALDGLAGWTRLRSRWFSSGGRFVGRGC